jgi:hypothetical protein
MYELAREIVKSDFNKQSIDVDFFLPIKGQTWSDEQKRWYENSENLLETIVESPTQEKLIENIASFLSLLKKGFTFERDGVTFSCILFQLRGTISSLVKVVDPEKWGMLFQWLEDMSPDEKNKCNFRSQTVVDLLKLYEINQECTVPKDWICKEICRRKIWFPRKT